MKTALLAMLSGLLLAGGVFAALTVAPIAKERKTKRTPEPGDSDYVSAKDPLASQHDPWIKGQIGWADCTATKTVAQCRAELN